MEFIVRIFFSFVYCLGVLGGVYIWTLQFFISM